MTPKAPRGIGLQISYLSTLHKRGADIFEALVLTFQGSLLVPKLLVPEWLPGG
jgi:hypothetical protein